MQLHTSEGHMLCKAINTEPTDTLYSGPDTILRGRTLPQ